MIIQAINTGILLSGFPPEFNLIIKAAIIVIILVIQSPQDRSRDCLFHRKTRPRGQGGAVEPMNQKYLPLIATLVIFVLSYAICAFQYPNMLSTRVIGNLLTDNAFLGIAAVGMTFVILSGGIDLSIGSVIAFTGIFLAVMLENTSIHPLAAFVLALAITTAFGALMGAIIHYLEMPAFIVTLAGMFLARGMAFVLSIDSIPIRHPFYATMKTFYYKLPGGGRITLIGGLMLLVFALGMLIAHRTRFGTNVYALGGGAQTVRPDGRSGRAYDNHDLWPVRFSGWLVRNRLFPLYISRLFACHGRRGAGRHRRCGDRGNAADRWCRLCRGYTRRRSDSGIDPDLYHLRRIALELVDKDSDRRPVVCIHSNAKRYSLCVASQEDLFLKGSLFA